MARANEASPHLKLCPENWLELNPNFHRAERNCFTNNTYKRFKTCWSLISEQWYMMIWVTMVTKGPPTCNVQLTTDTRHFPVLQTLLVCIE